jgi:excisionase family DNA binding protein
MTKNDVRNTIRALDKLSYSVNESARILGVSRSQVYAKIADGTLPSRRVLGKVVLLRDDLERIVANAEQRAG